MGKDEELTTTREKERKQRKKLNELQLKLEQVKWINLVEVTKLFYKLENEMRRKEAKLNEFEQEFKSVESEDLMLKRVIFFFKKKAVLTIDYQFLLGEQPT